MSDTQPVALRRTLGFWALVAYGVGDILGAGIYALVGKVAGVAGTACWLAFALALGVAALTALSYAELASRFPQSGGEAQFCQRAFRWPPVPLVIGWLVFSSGIVSMAAVSRAFAGYLLGLFPAAPAWSEEAVLVGFLLFVAAINFWGIRQSSVTNILCTVVEASGLLLVIGVGLAYLAGEPADVVPPPVAADQGSAGWIVLAQGGALAFFAFIGFEDMVNVAEEVKSPRRNLPRAILTALVLAGSVYIVVAWVATAVVPPDRLAESKAPLLEVVRQAAPGVPPWSFTLIALFAVANTGLLNCVMASRLLYGMSQQKLLPAWLGRVHPRTSTPVWSILAVLAAAVVLALSGTLIYLAGTTSVLLLLVFFTVNVALLVVHWRGGAAGDVFRAPRLVPIAGALSCLTLVVFVPPEVRLTAAVIVAMGLLLAAVSIMSGAGTNRTD